MKTPKELYEKQLRRLHRYISEGRGDDKCADVLRDQMLDVWYTFTPEEQAEARALAIRLRKEEESENQTTED